MKKLILIIAFALIGVTAFSQQVWKFQATSYSSTDEGQDAPTKWYTGYHMITITDNSVSLSWSEGSAKWSIVNFKVEGKSIFYTTKTADGIQSYVAVMQMDNGSSYIVMKRETDPYSLWFYVIPTNIKRIR